MQSSANVTLAECLLWDKGIDPSTLHLIDPACTGHVDDQTHMVTFSFEGDACGTEVMVGALLQFSAQNNHIKNMQLVFITCSLMEKSRHVSGQA